MQWRHIYLGYSEQYGSFAGSKPRFQIEYLVVFVTALCVTLLLFFQLNSSVKQNLLPTLVKSMTSSTCEEPHLYNDKCRRSCALLVCFPPAPCSVSTQVSTQAVEFILQLFGIVFGPLKYPWSWLTFIIWLKVLHFRRIWVLFGNAFFVLMQSDINFRYNIIWKQTWLIHRQINDANFLSQSHCSIIDHVGF